MTPKFDESNEAIQELPVELQQSLKRFAETGSDSDLNSVILVVLKDLGAEISELEITDETNFIKDVGLDSLAISEFAFFFEDFFQIRITNEEIVSLNTLGELKLFLSDKLV